MQQSIRPHYYFKHRDQLILNYCNNCKVCIESKTHGKRLIGLLSQLGPASSAYEIMSIDTIGGFSGNNSPKKYLHLLIDHFTRYAWIRTSSTQSASDFIQLLKLIIKNNEKPALLLADQYTGINSTELMDYLDKNDIPILFTSVDCPETNGLNERANQTLVKCICCKANTNPCRAWSKLAEESVHEYNNTVHTLTGFPPAYLLHGEKTPINPLQSMNSHSNLAQDWKRAFNAHKKFINEIKNKLTRTVLL